METRDVEFVRSITDRRIKATVPGPFTMTQAQNDHYAGECSLALAYAGAVNGERRDLKAAGADVVQIDEPYVQASRPGARVRVRGDRPSAGPSRRSCATSRQDHPARRPR